MKKKKDPPIVPIPKAAACVSCGCTDDRACPGGCYWYDATTCSACAIKQGFIKVAQRPEALI